MMKIDENDIIYKELRYYTSKLYVRFAAQEQQ